ncbi:hypothetical protein DSM106972_046110 [Dulcicalothrix desertica PCC 7102]|uniref:Nitrile hydratase alpha /Thiocyanate hydrolase gamma domain-containing protein n=1 Tax=Dulcicalothrix desertica PCC 7102 TaxID=232991 RepID=A0A3S1CIW4_9CYAN|nr:NHLP leader peptide family RiPP precursor [Dulcicalothrix desertica]RUT04383.1 hypothetical protein DSM106972_046110 [Dulcicalothrix desertica PCC 7102]TWH51237.1 putative ribosomally synthesized peptide [Dulcicalothrix desertica PCC 7102]
MSTENKRESIGYKIIIPALKDKAFKQELISNSAVAKVEFEKELGKLLPEDFSINVVEETPNIAYIVLPYMPSNEGLTPEQLEAIAGGINFKIPCHFGSATITNGLRIH